MPDERSREVTLDPGALRTLRPEDKGQAGACPDRTRAIPARCLGHLELRKARGPILGQLYGALLGFDGSQGRAHLYRSILEGIALAMVNNTAAMEHALGRRLSPVLVFGGRSRSDLMMQIVADVYGRPARRTAVNDAAGLGAAICAAVGHGIYPGWDQATAAMVSPGQQFTRTPGPPAPTSRSTRSTPP